MASQLGEKAIMCLRIAEAFPHDMPRWKALWEEADSRFSQKAILRKNEDLVAKGYLDYGVSVGYCWLTDKGRDALADLPNPAHKPWEDPYRGTVTEAEDW